MKCVRVSGDWGNKILIQFKNFNFKIKNIIHLGILLFNPFKIHTIILITFFLDYIEYLEKLNPIKFSLQKKNTHLFTHRSDESHACDQNPVVFLNQKVAGQGGKMAMLKNVASS